MGFRLIAATSLSVLFSVCSPTDQDPQGPQQPDDPSAPKAPIAERRPHMVESPNGSRSDPYYWLRDDSREDPDMLAYLNAENDYKRAVLAPQKALEETVYEEMVGRIQKNDESVPSKLGDYGYFTRVTEDKEFTIHLRKRWPDGPEEVYFDENERAEGKDYYKLSAKRLSPNHQLLAIAEDTQGRRQNVIRIKDLRTGEYLSDEIPGVSRSLTWAADNKTIFYIENDPTTLLSTRVKAHVIGTPVTDDRLVYEEQDKSYYMGVGRTSDDRYVIIFLSSTTTSEIRIIPANAPTQTPVPLAPRRKGVEYDADHNDGRWVIRTNLDAVNFRIMQVQDDQVGTWEGWSELVPHRPDVFVERFRVFDTHLVLSELSQGLTQLHVRAWDGSDDYLVDTKESAYVLDMGSNLEPSATTLRYGYTSPTTPSSVLEIDMVTRERRTLKTAAVGGGFNSDNYASKRTFITARDGTSIPVTILHKKGLKLDGSAPMLQYGYGSYGASVKPRFRSDILSLVDRGYVYAVAHVRGGGTMGRQWYEDGKLLTKMNTFNDFIDVTQALITQGYSRPERIVAMGGSAGGLLVGAVANMRPDLYKVIVANVPFVDVVTTMLDESIPLTTNEFDEWGNPKNQPYYDYMKSYSPYDNVKAQDYPAMLITAGLWDSQVQYYEPAKWVARLRHLKTDQNPLLFHINMDAGHGGSSGRFKRLEERAMSYAFMLTHTGE